MYLFIYDKKRYDASITCEKTYITSLVGYELLVNGGEVVARHVTDIRDNRKIKGTLVKVSPTVGKEIDDYYESLGVYESSFELVEVLDKVFYAKIWVCNKNAECLFEIYGEEEWRPQ